MRMRKIVLYVGLLAIIVGGAPYFTGYLVETKFQDVVRVLSDIDSTSVEIVKYDRGWRKSFAQTRVTLSGDSARGLIDIMGGLDAQQKNALKRTGLTVLLNHDIRHGPFVQMKEGDWKDWRFALAAFQSEVLLSEHAKEIFEKLFGQTKLFDIHGEMSIEGAVQVSFEGVPLALKEGNRDSFIWKGMSGAWRLTRDMKHFQSDIAFPGIATQSADKSIDSEGIEVHYNLHKSAEGLWLGKINGGVKKVAFVDAQHADKNVNIDTIIVDSNSVSQAGLVDGALTFKIEKMHLANQEMGPFDLEFSIKKFDAGFLKTLMDFSKHKQSAAGQAPNLQDFLKKVSDLLKNRPIIAIDHLSLKTAQGDVQGMLNIEVGGPEANNVNNTAQIIRSIAAKANLVFPKSILVDTLTAQYMREPQDPKMSADDVKKKVDEKVQETITMALKEGYLIERDNNYVSEWEVSEGQVKVNGRPVAMPPQVPMGAPPAATPPATAPVTEAPSAQ